MKKIIFLLLISAYASAQTLLPVPSTPTTANINYALGGAVAASGTDTYLGSLTGITSYTGTAFDIQFTNANTGSSTFNLNSLGAKALKKYSGGSLVDLAAGDIAAGERKRFYYNGTYLVMVSSPPSLPSGANKQIQFNVNNKFAASPRFTYDSTNRNLIVGEGNSVTGSYVDNLIVGARNSMTGGGWSTIIGEDNSITAGGGDAAIFGIYNTTGYGQTLLMGDHHSVQSVASFAGGRDADVTTGDGAGFVFGLGDNYPHTTGNRIKTIGGSFNVSHPSMSGSYGNYAYYSAILGGTDQNIPSGATNSVIAGGVKMSMLATDTSMVYVPNLRIRQGIGTGTRMLTVDALGHVGNQAIPSGGGGGITALTGDVTASGTGSVSATVTKINGTSLSGLSTGILKNTTSTGVPSIAVAGTDYQAPLSSGSGTTYNSGKVDLGGTLNSGGVNFQGTTAGAELITGGGTTNLGGLDFYILGDGGDTYEFDVTNAFGYATGTNFGTHYSACFGKNLYGQGSYVFAGGLGVSAGAKNITSSGNTAFNWSENTSAQTGGHGALAANSAILGGKDINIPSTATGSTVTASNLGKVSASVLYTLHSDNLRIKTLSYFGNWTTTPTSTVQIAAGTSTVSPFGLTSGTDLTTAAAGKFEYNGTRLAFSPSTTRKRVTLTNDVAPSNGQIAIGNGTDFTVASLTAGTGITLTPGSGSLTIAASGLTDPLTTNGDIIARVSGSTTRLAQGSNGTFLGVSGGALGYYTPSGTIGGLTTGRIPIASSSTAIGDNADLYFNSSSSFPSFNVGSGASNPLLILNYAANATTGGAFLWASNASDDVGHLQMNNQASYGGTINTTAGRTLSFYDPIAGQYRLGINPSGDFYVGASNSSYGFKVTQAGVATITSLTAGTVVSDGSGNLSTSKRIAGSYSGTGTATTTFTVTFGNTQANTSYKVLVTPTSSLSAALFYVINKTTTTFDVSYLAGLTGTVTFDYEVIP